MTSVATADAQLTAAFSIDYRYAVHFTRDALAPGNPVLVEALAGGGADDGGEGDRLLGAGGVGDGLARAGGGDRLAGVGGARLARVLAVIDAGVLRHHPDLPERLRAYAAAHVDRMTLAGDPLVLPGGEAVKQDPAHARAVLDAIDARAIDRHAYVLGIGGGAVLDAAGYAAGIGHRGVRMVRMPTTVLAQNDAGIGVKNGINSYGKKNFVGTFAPPVAVVNDERFLTTLADADWRAGTSEAVKVALLKDADFFAELERLAPALRTRDLTAMGRLVRRCAALHMEHIAGAGDPFELGSSRPLDFGHWAAHKLEALSGARLRHGEAVAIGIALDSTYARLAGILGAEPWRRVLALFGALGLPLSTPELDDPRLLDGLEEFREHLGGLLTVTLIEGIGAGVEVHQIDRELMHQAIAVLQRDRSPLAATVTG